MDSYFGDVIHAYSRREAIADGVLVDVSASFPIVTSAHFKVQVAFTASVWARIEAAVNSPRGRSNSISREGLVHDVLFLARNAPTGADESRRTFTVTLDEVHALEAICGPGDNLEPVITVAFPGED